MKSAKPLQPVGRRIKSKPPLAPDIALSDEEALLFHHWCIEIAPWFDLYDEERHFARRLPTIARKSRMLMTALLAYTSRQRLNTGIVSQKDTAIRYYNESISLLIHTLNIKNNDEITFTEVVILCALETMSSSWAYWRSHLNGISSILNGKASMTWTGLQRAAFWVFAREDTQLSLVQGTATTIDPQTWPAPSNDDTQRDDRYANEMLRLLAMVCNQIAHWQETKQEELMARIDRFCLSLPERFRPLAIIEGPICKVLYASTIQSSMFQMYHLAKIILYGFHDDRSVRHALHILGIANAGLEPTARIHATLPLYYAGQTLKSPVHRSFIITYLASMERELGWATESFRNKLQTVWRQESAPSSAAFADPISPPIEPSMPEQ